MTEHETPKLLEPGLVYSSAGEKVRIEQKILVFVSKHWNGTSMIHVADICEPITGRLLHTGSGLNQTDAIFRCVRKAVAPHGLIFPEIKRINHIRVVK